MEKLLRLKIYVDGVNDTPFPQGAEEPIEIGAFRYDAKRMGSAPTITASVNYPTCLDNEWTDKVYAEFNGEKYYLKQTPTSSYNNESTMYKHDLELVSERVILDNVYFFDTVVGDPQGDDKPVSNSTKVVFFGDIHEFAKRLQSSLAYSGIDYEVYVDSGVSTEGKLISFEDAFFSNVLQEIYNTYEQPYYFNFYTDEEGVRHKEIRIGKTNRTIEREFTYGVDDALLSITKSNANYKIVNRATGFGSSDNIPFYYPNNSPKGEIVVDATSALAEFSIVSSDDFSNEVNIGDVVRYNAGSANTVSMQVSDNGNKWETYDGLDIFISIDNMKPKQMWFQYTFNVSEVGEVTINGNFVVDGTDVRSLGDFATFAELNNKDGRDSLFIHHDGIYCGTLAAGTHTLKIGCSFPYLGRDSYVVSVNMNATMNAGWYNVTQDKETSLAKMGLAYSGTLTSGDTITQRLVRYVKTSDRLLPSVYRDSFGAERFYNAINYPYPKHEGFDDTLLNGYYGEDGILRNPLGEYEVEGYIHNDAYKNEDGTYIHFNNPYIKGRPKEHIVTADNIKPTIEGTKVNGLRIDMFSEFAYDTGDNNETYEDEEGNVFFKHPYFYGKLRVMDFNLFDHAIENQPMTISFTSGDCGACNFEIGVTEEYPQKNPVQVDDDGNLIRDDNGMVMAGIEGSQQLVTEFQERQQDTSKYEVWIALRKEEETYGILMPQVAHRPKADGSGTNEGDTFVILGINLPKSYILNAEKKLEDKIIKYVKENNDEKFNFSIKFSRIFFAEEENEEIFEALNENAQITVRYNNIPYTLFVSSYSYSMNDGETLPEISVELSESLSVSQNALQNAVSEIRGQIKSLAYATSAAIAARTSSYIQKQADDEAHGVVNFTKGIKFGEGGKVEILDNNSAKLTIEYLEVTKKATFTSLEIQEKTHVGGQILVTPAAINCGEVEEFDGYYRCYFQTKGTDGEEIFNQFAVDDQAICQTYNAWGSKYYWRLVVGIGEDYIDLSKVEGEYDEDSGIPSAGDKIIQLGNRNDKKRQNAIVIAAYGDYSPYIVQYKGIDSFELSKDKMVTKLASDENIFTGKVHMQMGSDGFENLGGSLNIGNQNMLRNSGFTGDYLSEPLADNRVMEAADKLFSAPFDHWTKNDGVTRVELPDNSASGYGVQFASVQEGTDEEVQAGVLSQEMYYPVLLDEKYILTFKAKGVVLSEEVDEESGETIKTFSSLIVTVGSDERNIALTDEWVKYTESFTASETSKVFSVVASDATVCEIQLERGTIATAWGNSPLDNSSDRAYIQSIAYLANGIEKEAIKEGATDVLGGLVLTNHIKVGNYKDHSMIEETAGVNGSYIDQKSPAFWAGGDFDKAIATAQKHTANTETPSDEVSFLVTHGGTVVINDAFVRGTVYADRGVFSGALRLSFQQIEQGQEYYYNKNASSSIWMPVSDTGIPTALVLPLSEQSADFDGVLINVFSYPNPSTAQGDSCVRGKILCPNLSSKEGGIYYAREISFPNGGFAQFTYSNLTGDWILFNTQAEGIGYVEYSEN